ncbi:hypothetical protein WJX73_006273 [Symbiochloris irregularis]|uniref:Uncharacterized protein n=1 Tax=Symbiochloris irregularis TaxID=706552 RepID=A0AAW1PIH6_9CHLO
MPRLRHSFSPPLLSPGLSQDSVPQTLSLRGCPKDIATRDLQALQEQDTSTPLLLWQCPAQRLRQDVRRRGRQQGCCPGHPGQAGQAPLRGSARAAKRCPLGAGALLEGPQPKGLKMHGRRPALSSIANLSRQMALDSMLPRLGRQRFQHSLTSCWASQRVQVWQGQAWVTAASHGEAGQQYLFARQQEEPGYT